MRRPAARRAVRLAAALGLLVVATAGCRIDVNLRIDVTPEGSGTVVVAVGLDDDALERVGDLEEELVVDDLVEAGWRITGPERGEGGLTWIRAERGFDTPEQLAAVVHHVSGDEGPFRDFELRQQRTALRTRYELTGVVDRRGSVEELLDEDLRAQLEGEAFGVDLAALAQQAQDALDRMFRVQVAVQLPGELTSNAPAEPGGVALWRPSLGERSELRASSTAWQRGALAWSGVLAALAVLAVAFLVQRLRRARRGREGDTPPA